MRSRPSIPLYHLQQRSAKSFELLSPEHLPDITHWNQAHRDDNYLLMFMRSGTVTLIVDFQEITIPSGTIYCILPGQVHYGLSVQNTSAWVLALDPAHIKDIFRATLANFAITNKPVVMPPDKTELLARSFSLLDGLVKEADLKQVTIPMLDVCVSLFTAASCGDEGLKPSSTHQPQMITRQFRSLLLLKLREMKNPSEYAAALNISTSYLREVVCNTTGYPPSHWIHQEIILEAKRMLFYTEDTVKEIAYLLGYTDTFYFSRLFSKVTGMPPLQFRSRYRK